MTMKRILSLLWESNEQESLFSLGIQSAGKLVFSAWEPTFDLRKIREAIADLS